MVNRCKKRLVGLDDRYGAGATVADACPLICGRPCDGDGGSSGGGATQDVSDTNEQANRPPENNSDEDIAAVLLLEEEKGNDEAETAIPTVVASPSIQEQVEEAGTGVEEKPTPTIASFGKYWSMHSRDKRSYQHQICLRLTLTIISVPHHILYICTRCRTHSTWKG